MELCIIKNGTKISKRKKSFYVDDKEKDLLLSAEKIDSIILEGEVSITSGAIRLAIENEIPLVVRITYLVLMMSRMPFHPLPFNRMSPNLLIK